MEIRIATEKDTNAILQLDDEGGFKERLIKKYICPIDPSKVERKLILLAVEDLEIVGKIELIIGTRGDSEKIGYLRRLIVLPNHRKKGIARALIEKTMSICKEDRVIALDLHVVEDNESAIALYKKMGFRIRHKEIHMRKQFH